MPAGNVYWEFSGNRGQSWQNAIGKLDVVSRDQHVKAVQQTYDNCIQFQETTHESKKVIWTFAPGVGFVQFGEGAWAFVLDRGASRANTGGSQPRVTIPTSTRPAPPTRNLLIGLSAHPFAGESLTPTSVRKHFEQSLSGGVNYIYLSPKWNELERSPGKYEFADLDFQIGQSVEYRVPAILNVRIIDTASRAFPADLENKS